MEYKRISDNYRIDGKELCWNLLLQWKAILLCALILAIALSGYSYVKERKAAAAINANNAAVTSAQDLLSAVPEDSRLKIEELYEFNKTKKQAAEYLNNSPFMNIDAYNHNVLELVWGIHFKSGEDNTISANKSILLTSYKNALTDESVMAQVAELWGPEYGTEDIKELICFDRGQHSVDTVFVTVILPEGVDVDGTRKILTDIVNNEHKVLVESVCPHDVLLVDDRVGKTFDRVMADQQASNYNRLYNIQNQMQAIQNTMNDQEKEIYANLLLLDKAMEEGKTYAELKGTGEDSMIRIKPFLFYMIVMMAVYVLVYTAYIYIKKRLFVIPDNERPLKSIGELHSICNDKQGIFHWLTNDKMLQKMRYKDIGDNKAALSRIANNMSFNRAEAGYAKTAIFTDAVGSEQVQALLPEFSDASNAEMGKVELTVSTTQDQFDSAVLLIERSKTSAYDVDKLAEQCIERHIPIIGSVYLV